MSIEESVQEVELKPRCPVSECGIFERSATGKQEDYQRVKIWLSKQKLTRCLENQMRV